nr:phosphopantetheine-binding protein [Flavilitoribacter sp.]
AIWQEVLGHEKISMDDDFFDLGGHSLKAVQIISRIISEFRITLEVKDIFDHTTIRQLAAEVGRQIGIADTGRSMEEIII